MHSDQGRPGNNPGALQGRGPRFETWESQQAPGLILMSEGYYIGQEKSQLCRESGALRIAGFAPKRRNSNHPDSLKPLKFSMSLAVGISHLYRALPYVLHRFWNNISYV